MMLSERSFTQKDPSRTDKLIYGGKIRTVVDSGKVGTGIDYEGMFLGLHKCMYLSKLLNLLLLFTFHYM